MDELSPLGVTDVHEVRGGRLTHWTFDAADHGLAASDTADLAGGSPAENAAIIESVLSGGGPSGARAAVILNAAAAIYVSPSAPSFGSAVAQASDALKAGRGMGALDRLRAAYRK